MSALKTLGAVAAVSLFPLAQAWYRPLPPCLSDFQPFVPAGCFDNGRDGAKPALTERMDMDIYNMTTEKCVDTCKGNGFRYAGLAYIGACYCGQTVDQPMIDNSQCHLKCSGNRSETCGGNAAINIYQDPTFLPVGETTVDEYVALGCHTDNVGGGKAVFYRQEQLDASTMTTKTCLHSCLAGGFPFAGTEYGGECYCGVVLGNGTAKVDDARCQMPCTGAPDEICGGPSLINIYVAKDLQSLEPCGYEPPQSSSVPTTKTSTTTATTKAPSTTTTKTKTTTTTTTTPTTTATTKASSTTTTKTTTTTTPTPPTTTKPPSTITSHLPATSSTTSAELCTSTVVRPGGCDYSCGKWCYNMPDFHDAKSCRKAAAHCKIQKWSCFKKAGMPHALDCQRYDEWCEKVDKYCDSCGGPRGCGKAACLTKLPVPTPLPTETVVAPCETTTTTTPLTTTSKAAPPTTTTTTVPAVPVPTGPGICKQPSNKLCGYRPGHPLGGIGLPALTCNNLAADFHAGNALKLYTEQDSARCPSFPKHESLVACAHACAAQFEECLAVYVPGVKHQGRFGSKTYGLGLNLGLGLDWVQAKACCSLQLLDCKAANLRPVVDGCHKFGDWV